MALQLRLCDSRCTHDTSWRHAHINLRCEVNQASGTSPRNMHSLCFSMCANSRVGAMTVLHDDIGHLMPLHDSADPSMHPVSSSTGFGAASFCDREKRELMSAGSAARQRQRFRDSQLVICFDVAYIDVSSTWVIPLVLLSENSDAAAEVLHVKSGVHEWMLHRPQHFR